MTPLQRALLAPDNLGRLTGERGFMQEQGSPVLPTISCGPANLRRSIARVGDSLPSHRGGEPAAC